MTIKIGKHTFNGPYPSTDTIDDKSGVYAIICKRDDKNYLIDVGEASEVKSRLDTHDRKKCWEEKCKTDFSYAVKYTPNQKQEGRKKVEQEIRKEFKPSCGEK